MNFASLAFCAFLPIVWSLYWILRRRSWQNMLLLAASYFFYGWWDVRFCVLMLVSTLVDYFISLGIENASSPLRKKRLLQLSLVCNLGMLGVFKYFNFFIENLVALGESVGWNLNTGTLQIILPVGISFYTFQTLSYTIDVYYGSLKPTRNLVEYMTFVSFFPQLVAGPIERASNLLPQFQTDRHFHAEFLSLGFMRILWGLFKKVVVADTVARFVNGYYNDPAAASGAELALATFLFAFQIYCDFSGYSDIAIGTSQMFGIKLMRNFAYPYFSQNLKEFWQRWHISLSTWFRDYVYIPLGGNRVGPWRQKANLLLTFLISGLWHGAAWPFVVWGGIHGAAVAAVPKPKPGSAAGKFRLREPGGTGRMPKFGVLVRILLTFSLVCLGWVFFRSATLTEAWLILGKIAGGLGSWEFYRELGDLAQIADISRALGLVTLLVGLEWVQRHREHPLELTRIPEPLRWSAYAFVFWFVAEYAGRVPNNPFIYFQF